MFGIGKTNAVVAAGLPAIYPRLWRYCYVLGGSKDAADDLAQATAARALEKADTFKEGTHLDRWIFTIAKRVFLNDRRAMKVRLGQGVIPIEDAGLADQSADAEMNISVAEVLSHVNALPPAQSEAVLLVYVEGFSYKEAAATMDIPIGTVMSRLSAARKTLSAAMNV